MAWFLHLLSAQLPDCMGSEQYIEEIIQTGNIHKGAQKIVIAKKSCGSLQELCRQGCLT
jgi:hypothetical protein